MRTIRLAVMGLMLIGSQLCCGMQDLAEIDLNRLGKIPARFNGRLTNLEEVANNYARSFGATTAFKNSEGKEYSALEWYLLTISNHDAAEAICSIGISNGLCEQLELPKVPDGRYSMEQLLTVSENFATEMRRIYEKDVQDYTEQDRGFLRLSSSLGDVNRLIASHRSPWELKAGDVSAELQFVDALESFRIPRMAIPNDRDSGRWQVLFVPAFKERVAEFVADQLDENEQQAARNPYARSLTELLVAIRLSDGEGFARHLQEVESMLEEKPFDQTALRFTPPKKWIEDGKESPHDFQLYSDAFTDGIPMAIILHPDYKNDASITINHFPDKKIDPLLLCNSWRLSEGLVLLTKGEFEAQISHDLENGTSIWSVDLSTPSVVPKEERRIVARIIHHSTGTWTSSLYGDPKTVAEELEAFDTYLDSLSIPDGVGQWVAPNAALDFTKEALLGIVKHGKSVDWLVRVHGEPKVIESVREEIVKAISELQDIEQASNALDFEQLTNWTPPRTWEELPGQPEHQRIYSLGVEEQGAALLIELMPLEPMGNDQIITMVNYLRASKGMEPLPAEEIQATMDLKNSQV